MKTLLIIWHSRTGAARQMAEAAAQGAREEPEITVRRVPAVEAGAEDLLAAQGYLFCAPENLASLSGEMKAFFDRAYYPVLDRLSGRPYGLLVAAGSDGQGVVRQVGRIAAGWRLRPVAEPVIVNTHAQTPEAILSPKTVSPQDRERCRGLGQAIAAGMGLGIF